MKPKEPLLSLMLSFIYPGLGQIYSGYMQRGILLIVLPLVVAAGLGWYIIQPETKLYAWIWVPVVIAVIFSIYIFVDSYMCAKKL